MFFTRTHNSLISQPKQEIINRLLGKHVRIHNIDFEIYEEDDGFLYIIPHTEQEESIKTLPETKIELIEKDNKTKVVTTFKMRQLDSGGPFLIVIFCAFLLIASVILFFVGGAPELNITYTMFGLGMLILILFSYRMQTGYFDYIRKIRAYINGKKPVAVDVNLPAMQA